ncbi:MAG TPA: MFS transporter [Gaiellales bacterium]|jgi:DHA3 family tetracycline resistance protein-like MFS transporter
MLAPLRLRDFRLLWTGLTVSLLGDGVYVVAIAWQAYQISDSPFALAVTGVAWTLPSVVVLPFSGALSDRLGRRPLMIAANALRAVAALGIGLLAVAGSIEIWHLIVLSVVFGLGEALFGPSFTAIVPEIVPEHLLVQANSLDQAMRPLAMQFAGPALGGALVASVGPGSAFLFDAGSLLFGAAMLALMHVMPAQRRGEPASLVDDMREGARYVRANIWLWATLLAFSVTVLVFWGPTEVLVPFVIKNDLGGGAGGFGIVLAAGGAGAIVTAVAISVTGLPARRLGLVYAAFIVAGYGTALYGLADALWQMAATAALAGACFSAGLVAWSTTMQSRVPPELLGRVSSLDWMVSICLLPVSYALVGPISDVVGARATLVGSGVVAGTILVVALAAVPEVRRPEPERVGAET